MLVSSIRLFNNSKINMGMNAGGEVTSLSNKARKLPRLLASEPKPKRIRPELTQAEKERLERLNKQAEEANRKGGTPAKSEHEKRTDEQIWNL